MATLADVRSAMVSCTPEHFTPYFKMSTLVTTGTVLLQNGETVDYEELTPHASMMPDARTFLDRDASVIVLEIFNAMVKEEAVEGEMSFSDRIVAENALAPPTRRTLDEQAVDDAQQASLVGVVFLPSDLK